MRRQTECNLVVRLTWDVTLGHSHPRYTFVCVQDEDMAAMVARRADEFAPRGLRLVGAEASPSAGRDHPWVTVGLGLPTSP
ncbi:MAG: hypothetical protein HOY79_49805 [Streptomyces sp.]|nr:hypothetical protein [Streptomyces sp.]